jgi:hypothetical protein
VVARLRASGVSSRVDAEMALAVAGLFAHWCTELFWLYLITTLIVTIRLFGIVILL